MFGGAGTIQFAPNPAVFEYDVAPEWFETVELTGDSWRFDRINIACALVRCKASGWRVLLLLLLLGLGGVCCRAVHAGAACVPAA